MSHFYGTFFKCWNYICRSLIHSTWGLGLSANFNAFFLDALLVFRGLDLAWFFHWIMLAFKDWFGFG